MLLRKQASGKLDTEELSILNSRNALSSRTAENSPTLNLNANTSAINTNPASRSASRDSKTDRNERALPLLNPQLNIADITYSIKEKITINSAPNKNVGGTTNHFNVFVNTKPPISANTAMFNPPSRDPKNEFKKVATTAGKPYAAMAHSTVYPDSYLNGSASRDHAKQAATRSFDMDRNAGDYSGSGADQNSKKLKSPQHPSNEFYGTDPKRSVSSEVEPKSRKLLELMLKRISKLSVDENHANLSATQPKPKQATPSLASSDQRGGWDPAKSISLDQNKKKLNLTIVRGSNAGGHTESREDSRRSSRESSQMQPTGTGAGSLTGQTPISSNPASKPTGIGKGKQIQIRNLRVRPPGGG